MNPDLQLKNVGPPLSSDDLSRFEQETGMVLPLPYKAFLLRQNGGDPANPIGIRIEGKITEIVLFMSLEPSEESGLRGAYSALAIDGLYPPGCLPIARTDMAASVCITDARKGGAIVLSRYLYDNDENPVELVLVPIAGSFDEFWSWLIPIPQVYCPVIGLAKSGDGEDLAAFLQEGGSINAQSKHGYSLLCEAILRRNRPLIDACLKAGASLRGTASAAIHSRIPDILDQMIKAGADVEEPDQYGRLPLQDIYGTGLPGEEGVLKRQLEKLLLDAIRSNHPRG